MSDVSPGAGWWMASDGKWYPPALHPAAAVPPPGYPPGYGPPPGRQPPPGYDPGPVTAGQGQDPAVRIDPVLGHPLAPWWKRLVAILVDGALLALAYIIIVVGIVAIADHLGSSTATNTNTTTGSTPGQVVAGLVGLWILGAIPTALYCGLMNGSRRGTLGKMALGIAVRDSRTGQAIGFWRGLGRYLITMVFTLALFVPFVVDNLSPLWDGRRQAWHDKTSHSVVVDLKP